MPKIKFLIPRLKAYLAERARIRSLWKSCSFLIKTELMEASVRSYMRELEAKVDAQAKVIRLQRRQLQDLEYARIDREIDLKETARWKSRHEAVA